MDTIEHNVAALKRLRDMLTRQREKFGSYLHLLECESESIQAGTPRSSSRRWRWSSPSSPRSSP